MSRIPHREPGRDSAKTVGCSARATPAFIRWAAPAVAPLLLLILLHHDLPTRLEYPPGMDQDLYLASGRDLVESFGFQPRAPLYGAWVGLNYLGAGLSQESCFYLEKFTNILLLAVLTSYLFYILADLRTSVFMTFWLLNCKYLVFESNGSNSFATSLLLASLLCLFLCPPRARLPCALFVLYLSALVRPEMQIVSAALSVLVLLFAHRSRKAGESWNHNNQLGEPRYWASAGVLALVLTVGMLSRPGRTPSNDPHGTAFLQHFAVTYVDRYHLRHRFPDRWNQYHEVLAEVMPGVDGTFDAVRKYPGKVFRHMVYNARVSARALPAMAFGLINPKLVLFSGILWVLSYILDSAYGMSLAQSPAARSSLSRDQMGLFVLWVAATLLIIPICVFVGIQARFYIIMIPIIQLTSVAIVARLLPYLSIPARAIRVDVGATAPIGESGCRQSV